MSTTTNDAHELVLIERDPAGYAVLTLNRPDVLNALSRALRQRLAEAFEELADDASIRVAILTGAGRGFCAGLDLKELAAAAADGSAASHERPLDPVAAIGRFPGPVICAVNGAAITGGFELALAGDVLLASEQARFADTHARVGIMPGWGLSQKLSRLIGVMRAKELSLSGNFLSAAQAEAWGLVNRVVPADELLPQARRLALDMLEADPGMLLAMKRLIDDGYALPFGEALALERERGDAARRYDAPGVRNWQDTVRNRGRAQAGEAT
ncbi:enoyl-CoA hydratase [Verticiella sediminum]|uniref:Enoyl-CoA hydratase n=1 Tax=Verticiella sediminum TaxID=1247510 RepID=A0A556AYG8_9BURK|nr:enoyl-CoA hydratase [Verticiella sediminum]TSH97977.1 enoyl-CoA hydratase [Verticiella sediminum]